EAGAEADACDGGWKLRDAGPAASATPAAEIRPIGWERGNARPAAGSRTLREVRQLGGPTTADAWAVGGELGSPAADAGASARTRTYSAAPARAVNRSATYAGT